MLTAKNTKPYAPTSQDRLWLLRAVVAEGKPHHDVARTLVNLFMLQRSKGNKQTLSELVRAYAQPVNPRWFADGDKFRALGAPTKQQLEQATSREFVHSMRNKFPDYVVAAVDTALRQGWSSDVTDYAVATLDASKKGYVARTQPIAGENRFWSRQPGWAGYVASGTGLALVALALAVVWLKFKGG